jgi:hypothetical protein
MRSKGVARHRLDEPQRRSTVLSPNHQSPTTYRPIMGQFIPVHDSTPSIGLLRSYHGLVFPLAGYINAFNLLHAPV